ncbi:MAG TPA: glycosyltransferase [Oligoflexia bacterium]|nr:glycosyltransferase [Oligoflexia bacterium]
MKKTILLVIPCFNPSAAGWRGLSQYLERLTGLALRTAPHLEFQAIVVDDGSTLWCEPPELEKDRPYQLVRLEKNLGKGGAIGRILELSHDRYDLLAITDFDTPYSERDLLGMCCLVEWNAVQVCIGDRSMDSSYETSVGPGRLLFHRAGRLLVRTMIAGGFSDTQCGIKVYSYPFVKKIAAVARIRGFLFDLEWVYIALKHGLTVARWPVAISEKHQSGKWFSKRYFKCFFELMHIIVGILSSKYKTSELQILLKKARLSHTGLGDHSKNAEFYC